MCVGMCIRMRVCSIHFPPIHFSTEICGNPSSKVLALRNSKVL
jgi:hypothetical protein